MNPVRLYFKYLSALIFIIFYIWNSVNAQDSTSAASSSDKWRFRVEPYFMMPNMSGKSGVAGLPLIEIDEKAKDIFERLKFGGMIYLEASKGKWSFGSDLVFMHLEQDVKTGTVIKGGAVDAKQLGWELFVLRKIRPWLEFGVGGLLNNMEMDININVAEPGGGTSAKTGSKSMTWYDPMFITRISTSEKKKFYGQLRGEIGGFGIGSDLAWQAQAIAGYRFSRLFDMSIGYRAIGLDYQDGEGEKAFIYDVVNYGAVIRFGFSF